MIKPSQAEEQSMGSISREAHAKLAHPPILQPLHAACARNQRGFDQGGFSHGTPLRGHSSRKLVVMED